MLMAFDNSLLFLTGPSVTFGMLDELEGVERLGRRLNTSCRFPRMAWLTGRSPLRTLVRYVPMSRNLKWRPCNDCNCEVILVDRVPTATSRISLNKCSTPISSASSASIIEGVCTKVLDVVVPS